MPYAPTSYTVTAAVAVHAVVVPGRYKSQASAATATATAALHLRHLRTKTVAVAAPPIVIYPRRNAVTDPVYMHEAVHTTLVTTVHDGITLGAVPQSVGRTAYATVGIDLMASLQLRDLTVPVIRNGSITVAVSFDPPALQMFARDNAPTFRFHLVEDGTGADISLDGATVRFLVRRQGQLQNVFQSVSGADLTLCTILPNPGTFTGTVTGNPGAPQTVTLTDVTGIAVGTLLRAGPGTANDELLTVTAVNSGGHTVSGIFVNSHAAGDTCAPLTSTLYNSRSGYCTYQWPVGGLKTIAAYEAQLRITHADGSVEHSAPLTITLGTAL